MLPQHTDVSLSCLSFMIPLIPVLMVDICMKISHPRSTSTYPIRNTVIFPFFFLCRLLPSLLPFRFCLFQFVLHSSSQVDWWCLGTLLYEMLCGKTPFHSSDLSQVVDRILNGEVNYPAYVSPDAKLLISQLLEKNPKKRLGLMMMMRRRRIQSLINQRLEKNSKKRSGQRARKVKE